MKRLLPLLCLMASLLPAAPVAAQPRPDPYRDARIAALEREADEIRRECFRLSEQQSCFVGERVTSANKFQLDLEIPRVEAIVAQLGTTRDELAQLRAQTESGEIFSERDAERSRAAETAAGVGQKIFLAGASKAAQRAAAWADYLFKVGEKGDRWRIRHENMADLDRIIANHRGHLNDMNDLLASLYIERAELNRELIRLRELQERWRAVDGELTDLRNRRHTAATPLPPARSAAIVDRETDDAGDQALRDQANREAMHVGDAEPGAIRAVDLVGSWTGSGYQCEGAESDEYIDISYSPAEGLVATKSLGDNCIHSTEVTWRGVLEGNKIRARFHVREPGADANADRWIEGELEVISKDEIRGFGVTFRR